MAGWLVGRKSYSIRAEKYHGTFIAATEWASIENVQQVIVNLGAAAANTINQLTTNAIFSLSTKKKKQKQKSFATEDRDDDVIPLPAADCYCTNFSLC